MLARLTPCDWPFCWFIGLQEQFIVPNTIRCFYSYRLIHPKLLALRGDYLYNHSLYTDTGNIGLRYEHGLEQWFPSYGIGRKRRLAKARACVWSRSEVHRDYQYVISLSWNLLNLFLFLFYFYSNLCFIIRPYNVLLLRLIIEKCLKNYVD